MKLLIRTPSHTSFVFNRHFNIILPSIFNPLNAELNPICHLLALLGGATIVVVSRLRVNVVYGISCCYLPRSNSPLRTSYDVVVSEFVQMIQMSVDSVKHIRSSHSHIQIQMVGNVSYPAHA
jgi:hypothetical protein